MRFYFFASFIVFCIWLGYEIHKHRNMEAKDYEAFWDREHAANSTRRKSLDGLNYITIPVETFPFGLVPQNEQIAEYEQTICDLAKEPVVNLTGFSNTDLKLEYGAPNIDLLSLYDQRYTTLVCTLQSWAALLYKEGQPQAARVLLEFAIDTHTDIYASYELLVRIYKEYSAEDQIAGLLPVAQQLHSLSRTRILTFLEAACPKPISDTDTGAGSQ